MGEVSLVVDSTTSPRQHLPPLDSTSPPDSTYPRWTAPVPFTAPSALDSIPLNSTYPLTAPPLSTAPSPWQHLPLDSTTPWQHPLNSTFPLDSTPPPCGQHLPHGQHLYPRQHLPLSTPPGLHLTRDSTSPRQHHPLLPVNKRTIRILLEYFLVWLFRWEVLSVLRRKKYDFLSSLSF